MGAARTITEECERLLCGTLRAYFLGEKEASSRGPLVVGASFGSDSDCSDDLELYNQQRYGHGYGPGRGELTLHDTSRSRSPEIVEHIEVWDYMGGALFRGFTVYDPILDSKTLFTFFDDMVFGRDLKQGFVPPSHPLLYRSTYANTGIQSSLMALIELSTTPSLSSTSLILCIDKTPDNPVNTKTSSLIRDLGWVGFEATTLEAWCPGAEERFGKLLPTTSERWLLLGMEV